MTPADLPSSTLVERARSLGVETTFQAFDGTDHDADPEAVAIVVELLDADERAGAPADVEPVVVGGHRPIAIATELVDAELHVDGAVLRPGAGLVVADDRRSILVRAPLPVGCHDLRVETAHRSSAATVVVAPDHMPVHAGLRGGSALFVPTYALWDDDRPLPSFSLLARLAERLPPLGIDVLTTLPIFAALLDEPFDPSPYAPASRLHWNELYIDDRALPEAPIPDAGRYLDFAALAVRRRSQLEHLASILDDARLADLEQFVADRPDVDSFARFTAERLVARRPADAGATGTAGDSELLHRSVVLGQLLAHEQLAELSGSTTSARLALDLPIGCHPDGWESHRYPGLFAEGVSIGAPPDAFFRGGQNWSLPPQLPAAGRRSGHRLWRDLVTRAGEHVSLLRIDHVMAVHRLWWVPEGFPADRGVYVRYPREELMAVLAAVSHTSDTTLVGEDLGTVPPAVRSTLDRWGMIGLYEEQFAIEGHTVSDIPARSLAGMRTHDMEPFAAFFADPARAEAITRYRQQLTTVLDRPVGPDAHDVFDAASQRLARSEATLVTVDLDDLLGETEPHNVPGRVLDTTWRRRLDRSLSVTLDEPEVRAGLHTISRRSTHSTPHAAQPSTSVEGEPDPTQTP